MKRNLNTTTAPAIGLGRWFCLATLWFCLVLPAYSQQIIWEKYWPNIKGRFEGLVQGDSGFFYGCGPMQIVRNYNQPVQYRDTLSGIILVKLTSEGDTIWIKKICDDVSGGASSGTVFMQKGLNGLLYLSLVWFEWPVYEHRIFNILQTNGLILHTIHIPITTATTLKGTSTDNEENLYLYGEREKATISNTYEMYCIKVRPNGEIDFDLSYSPGNHPSSAGQYMEPMAGGKMRLSGNKGKTIVAYELNADGTVADYKEYIDNPFGVVQQNGAYVQQAERGFLLLSAQKWSGPSGPNTASFKEKVDSNGLVLWHEDIIGSVSKLSPTLSGGYLIVEADMDSSRFRCYNKDNGLVWSVNTMTGGIPGRKGTGKLMFLNDNSGVHYGVTVVNGTSFPFAMKIDNVGYPVDPTNPVPPVLSNKETAKAPKVSYAFPNPTTGIFHVLGMGSGLFKMVDSHGRVVLEAGHKGGDAIDVSALPCGVYTYTLKTPNSRTEGRIVRE